MGYIYMSEQNRGEQTNEKQETDQQILRNCIISARKKK